MTNPESPTPSDSPLTPTTGVQPHQLIQAGVDDTATIACGGKAPPDLSGVIEARVTHTVTGETVVDWRSTGNAGQGAWNAMVEGVAVGGPYAFEVRLAGSAGTKSPLRIAPIFVGDLWLLAGQSNMQGCANLIAPPAPDDRIVVFAMNDTWRVAEEPVHRPSESCDYVQTMEIEDDEERQGLVADVTDWPKGMGPGLSFAKEVLARTDRPVGLVPCAKGGALMDEWSPELRDQGGRSLYGAMLRRLAAVGGKVKGVLWYQGESDGMVSDTAADFKGKFRQFIKAVRSDFNAPELPFYYVQISRFSWQAECCEPWNAVQQAQLEVESEVAHCAMVPAIDLDIDDLIHIGAPGQIEIGRRLALVALRETHGIKGSEIGPRLAEVSQRQTPYGLELRVRFTGVNGHLVAQGRVAGFSLTDAEGNRLWGVYNQTIDPESPDTAIVWFQSDPALPPAIPESARLWYGRGCDPYCNLVDEAGMAVPVFGPLRYRYASGF